MSHIKIWLLRYQARQARARGDYTVKTQAYFLKVWRLSGKSDDLLAFLLFRRDRGLILSKYYLYLLQDQIVYLSGKQKILAKALLLESIPTIENQEKFLKCRLPQFDVPVKNLKLPTLLAKSKPDALSKEQLDLGNIARLQFLWREQFAQKLRQAAHSQGIFVIGNAGIIRQLDLIAALTHYNCIVRFNQFTPDLVVSAMPTIWVLTPSFQIKQAVPVEWVVLIGPDLQYRLMNWNKLKPMIEQGTPIITLPLFIWRQLVLILKAPPSAGVAFLALVHHLLGSWHGVNVAGFSALSTLTDTYHVSNPKHQPSRRHNWEGEAALLKRWQVEGLKSIHE
ncbi:hypothetical protein [Thiolinea disciformis]|uniref:hypothetical protein n=1 Tax=Thiolinea disciformis TaxID=125614 RepID=UPI00039EE7CB|nr:hypothetical protein [Thiolinea disciformis]